MTADEAELKLKPVQLWIERLVKEHGITIREWNQRTVPARLDSPLRVEKVMGGLLRQRDRLVKISEAGY